MLFYRNSVFDLLSAVKTVFIFSPSAHSDSHMLRHKNTLVQACLVKRKIPQLGEDFSVPCLVPLPLPSSAARLQCHPAHFFQMLMFTWVVTGGPSTLPLYFWTGRAACQEEQTDGWLWAAARCPVRLTWRQFARWHWRACLRQGLHLGEEGVEAGKPAGKEERRRGLQPSGELEFLLSHSPIWLAVVKTIGWHTLSLHADGFPAMSQLWEQQVVEKVVGLLGIETRFRKALDFEFWSYILVVFPCLCPLSYIGHCVSHNNVDVCSTTSS